MEKLNLCATCNHDLEWHQETSYGWLCDELQDNGEYCACDAFIPKRASGRDGDEIEVPYDNESYRWN